MPIRIMHVVDTLETGGLERGVVNLIQRMDPERFSHTVCAIRNLGPLAAELPAARVNVVCLNKTAPGYTCLVPALYRQIEAVRPQVVHSRNWGTIETVLAGRWSRSRGLVHSEHGMESAGGGNEPVHKRSLRRFAFELVDRVFSVSYQLRDLYAGRTGFPSRRISVIHNGVDTVRFRPRPEIRSGIRRQFQIGEDEFCIGAVGRLEPVKSHVTLLQAAACLPAGKWRVILAGEGSEMASLRRLVAGTPGLADRVTFTGEITQIPDFLNALDAYVLPSLSEGFSNSLLEAMATGLPVIATATGGNPEVVVPGECGLLFPVGDWRALAASLLSLKDTPSIRMRLGEGAVVRMKDFSMHTMVKKYEDLYEDLGARNKK